MCPGFYNSNLLAGASQAHKHMQFIPLDETWKFRDGDAQYVSWGVFVCVLFVILNVIPFWSLQFYKPFEKYMCDASIFFFF